jgi:hypothetical protein
MMQVLLQDTVVYRQKIALDQNLVQLILPTQDKLITFAQMNLIVSLLGLSSPQSEGLKHLNNLQRLLLWEICARTKYKIQDLPT